MSYRKALERLRAHTPRELIQHDYFRGELTCAIGALLPRDFAGVLEEKEWMGQGIEFLARRLPAVRERLEALDLSWEEAEDIQVENDRYIGPAERRYDYILRYLEERVAEEPS